MDRLNVDSKVGFKYKVYTFGCKVNTYDSGLIEKSLHSWGFSDAWSNQRVHILNTCAVTAEATKEAVRNIRRLKVKDPFCTVVVTGCSAQVDTSVYESLPGADLVVANSHKTFLPELIEQYFKGELKEKIFKSNIFRKEDLGLGGGEESQHTRAFLKIQDGCNSFCSYCIIPYARGKSRSIPIPILIERIKDLERAGYQEVVLTGVHIGDYLDECQGRAEPKVLEDLIEQVLLKTQISRIRLTSLEPIELSDRLFELFREERLCPHFHMSIQSAEDQVLRDMKRKYTAQEVYRSLMKIQHRMPGAFVGMDVIVGFPSETEERFQKTWELLSATPWTRLHVFPFSERPGTKAAAWETSVATKERHHRSELLRRLSWQRFQEQAQHQVGQRKKVLIIKPKDHQMQGLSRDYWPVSVSAAPEGAVNQEHWVRINGWTRPTLSNFEVHLKGAFEGGSIA